VEALADLEAGRNSGNLENVLRNKWRKKEQIYTGYRLGKEK
jgi:lambda repressor-like predicted transcriptional regulator